MPDDNQIHQDDEDTDNEYFDKDIDEVYEETFGNDPSGDTISEAVDKDEEKHHE